MQIHEIKKLSLAAATGAALLLSSSFSFAGVTQDLAIPTGTPTAAEIADQVYFVNHFYALKNYGITKKVAQLPF